MHPIASLLRSVLHKEAKLHLIPEAFAPIYINERVQHWLLMSRASDDLCSQLSHYFPKTKFNVLNNSIDKSTAAFVARYHDVYDWPAAQKKRSKDPFLFETRDFYCASKKGTFKDIEVETLSKIIFNEI
jgi:hypothetical protein